MDFAVSLWHEFDGCDAYDFKGGRKEGYGVIIDYLKGIECKTFDIPTGDKGFRPVDIDGFASFLVYARIPVVAAREFLRVVDLMREDSDVYVWWYSFFL